MTPLYTLLKKEEKWLGTSNQETAFNTMKQILLNVPSLVQPDFRKQLYLVTDASSIGVGGYLGQGQLEEKEVLQYARKSREMPKDVIL